MLSLPNLLLDKWLKIFHGSKILFILMQEFHLEGAVSSLGLGRKLKEHEFERKHGNNWFYLLAAPHIGNSVKLFPLFPATFNYLDHSLAWSSQVGPAIIDVEKTSRCKDKSKVSCDLAMTSARASVTSSNSVCNPSNNPLHSSSCVNNVSPSLEEPTECLDYLKVESKHVAAAQNCPNLTTWCRIYGDSEDNIDERKILELLMSRRIAPLTIPKRRPHKTEKANMSTYFMISSQSSLL